MAPSLKATSSCADATGLHELPNGDGGGSWWWCQPRHDRRHRGRLGQFDLRGTISIRAGTSLLAGSDNTIEGNLIGTDITGEAALPLLPGDVGGVGVFIIEREQPGNTVGGHIGRGPEHHLGQSTAPAFSLVPLTPQTRLRPRMLSRAILSAPTPWGSTSLANTGDGVEIASGAFDNTIGGTVAGASNVISGNTVNGVEIYRHWLCLVRRHRPRVRQRRGRQ